MMPRYEHYFSRVKNGQSPKRIYTISVANPSGTPKGGMEDRTPVSDEPKWAIAAVRSVRYASGGLSTGKGGQQLLNILSILCKSSGVNWIIGDKIIQCFETIGMWEMLELGQLQLGWINNNVSRELHSVVSEMRIHQRRGSSEQEQQMGSLVQHLRGNGENANDEKRIHSGRITRSNNSCSPIMYDPPTIIHLSIPGLPGKLLFLDARNWFNSWNFQSPYPCETACQLAALFSCMLDTCERHKIDPYRVTVASQAWHTWRRDYPQHSVLCHTHKGALELENNALQGGRCEAFLIGKEIPNVYHLDYRALYPSCCQTSRLPVRLVQYHNYDDGLETRVRNECSSAIADCIVVSREPSYPYKREGITIYPVGRYRTVLCGPELVRAYDRKEIYGILAYATYDMEPVMSEWPSRCDKIRREYENAGDNTLASWAKSLANTICGRFARRGARWIKDTTEPASKPYDEWYATNDSGETVHYRSIAWNVEREIRETWGSDSIPAVSAWIMSAARIKLWETMKIAGKRHVYYVDTDSLFVDETGLERLQKADMIAEKKLGKLQIRGGLASFYCLGYRHYYYDGKLTRAGFAKPCLGLSIGTGKMRHAFPPAPYRHGIVGNDGWVRPYKLEG